MYLRLYSAMLNMSFQNKNGGTFKMSENITFILTWDNRGQLFAHIVFMTSVPIMSIYVSIWDTWVWRVSLGDEWARSVPCTMECNTMGVKWCVECVECVGDVWGGDVDTIEYDNKTKKMIKIIMSHTQGSLIALQEIKAKQFKFRTKW